MGLDTGDTVIERRLAQKLEYMAENLLKPEEPSDEELRAWYANAEAFLYPSLAESFGLPVLEAMACGTPVLTSNVTSMPEVAADAALLVDPNRVGAMARGMHLLSSRPDLRNTLRRRGLRRVRRFTWSRVATRTATLYQQAA